jgi:hypothetical protein
MSVHGTLVGHTALVHRAIERMLDQLAAAVPSDRELGARAVGTAIRAHHHMEDEVLLPVLRDKGAEGPWDRIGDDHEAIAAGLDDPAALRGRLREHFALEEQALTESFWRGLLSDDEARALGKAISAHAREHLVPTAEQLPLLLYNLTDAERAEFTDRMPAFIVQGLVPFAFRASWRKLRPFMAFAPRRLLS